MTKNHTFLVIGHIVLNIGILGYFTNNSYLAFICVSVSFVFFIRQLITLHYPKAEAPNEASTITN